MEKSAIDVALAFIHRINDHDLNGLVALMTEDHCFIDGLGQAVQSRLQMEKAWAGYFAYFPDYFIEVENTLSDGDVVALFGTAQGTYSEREDIPGKAHWKIPAAWKAIVRNGLVAEWQVYADNEPVRKIVGMTPY